MPEENSKTNEEKILKLNEELTKSERRFRGLVENNNDILRLSDENFKPVYRSPNLERITGWKNEEVDKEGDIALVHPEDRERMTLFLSEIKSNPGKLLSFDYRFKHKAGHSIWVEGTAINMLHDTALKGIVTNFRDVSERKEAEEKLIRSEKIYKTIASSIPGSVICLLDADYRYFLIEGDMLEQLSYSKENLLGKKIQDVLSPERYVEVLADLKRVFKGETFSTENKRDEYETISRFVPLRDENNNVYAAMIVLIDISELKKAEHVIAELNRDLEEKIIKRTDQLEAVNKELELFSYSVSHDLRAPLRAINGYSTILEEDYSQYLDEKGKRVLGRIKINAMRMGLLIEDLLEFSKLGQKEIHQSFVDMTALANDVVDEISKTITHHAEIKIDELHDTLADSALIKQVMINLISNAIKYSSKTERPLIEIKSSLNDNEVTYTVSDNGVGFNMDYSHKLFEVFQRLHSAEEFEGTGVGLAMAKRIINKHGGKIWAEGIAGKGANFFFCLPYQQKSGIKQDSKNFRTSNNLIL
ncbi:MAG: PAS domain S-box protein [Bacteroidia bacterium]